MNLQERRTSMGWTQEQLAQHSGLSVRTIQRLENGQSATLESLKCLAATFDTTVTILMQEQKMTSTNRSVDQNKSDQLENDAIEYVQNLKGFYMHCILFAVIIPCLFALNMVISPDRLWIHYVVVAWLFGGIGIHAVIMFSMYSLFGGAWEQRQFRKRLDMN